MAPDPQTQNSAPTLENLAPILPSAALAERQHETLREYVQWKRAFDQELKLMESVAEFGLKVSTLHSEIETRRANKQRTRALEDEWAKYNRALHGATIELEANKEQIKRMAQAQLSTNPFDTGPKQLDIKDFSVTQSRFDAAALLRADLIQREHQTLLEVRTLLGKGEFELANKKLAEYQKKLPAHLRYSEKDEETVQKVGTLQRDPRKADATRKVVADYFEPLRKAQDMNDPVTQDIRAIQRIANLFSREHLYKLGYILPVAREILDAQNIDELLSTGDLEDPSKPSATKKKDPSIVSRAKEEQWDTVKPWATPAKGELQLDLVVTHYAVLKRLQLIQEALTGKLEDVDKLPPAEQTGARKKTTSDVFALYTDTAVQLTKGLKQSFQRSFVDGVDGVQVSSQRERDAFALLVMAKGRETLPQAMKWQEQHGTVRGADSVEYPLPSRMAMAFTELWGNKGFVTSAETDKRLLDPNLKVEELRREFGRDFAAAEAQYTSLEQQMKPYQKLFSSLEIARIGSQDLVFSDYSSTASVQAPFNALLNQSYSEARASLNTTDGGPLRVAAFLEAFRAKNSAHPEAKAIDEFVRSFETRFRVEMGISK